MSQVSGGPGSGDDDDDPGGLPPPGESGSPFAEEVQAEVDVTPPPPLGPLPDLAFDEYHSLDEIGAYLRAVAEARPALVSFHVLGESAEGREIAYVVIDATGSADPPALFANGTTHGDEKPGTEAALILIDHLLRHGDDPDVAAILGKYAVYVLPVVNPDGHYYDIRGDHDGTDPNRDWAFPGRSEAESFDLVETQLQKSLLDAVEFRASLSYHTGLEMFAWPWGYDYESTDDDDLFYTLSSAGCDAAGYYGCSQAAHNYPAAGLDMDYAYWKHGTIAVTVEVSGNYQPDPSYLPGILEDALAGSMAFMKAVYDVDQGMLAPREAPPWDGKTRHASEFLE